MDVIIGTGLLLVLALVLGYMLFILPAQWVKTERVKVSLGLNRKILQISDMHVERLRVSAERLGKIIGREKPDYLFLTGDFATSADSLPRLEKYLRIFDKSGVPVYAVLGNHDYRIRRTEKLVQLLAQHGIRVLRNQSVSLPGFTLVGIDDACSKHSHVRKAFRGVPDNGQVKSSGSAAGPPSYLPVVVITHDPNVVLHMEDRKYDYMMAGHLHGKQFNLPFLYRFKPMGELPAQGIYKGLHRIGGGALYISKGIGQSGLNARLFVRSEVTLHEL